MVETLNFREFYQKTPIPISKNDRLTIENEASYSEMFNNWSHWLIALEGKEIDWKTIEWRVLIFPSNACGKFNDKFPYYKSPLLRTFHEAFDLSRELEKMAKQDRLIPIHI